MSERLHDSLKQWLVELGERTRDAKGNAQYEAYSGDSQPIDIRYRKKHVEYSARYIDFGVPRLRVVG